MATEVILPRVDMDMAEGKIAHWYVKDGDAVRKGQVLFEIETDKATMEVDAPADGTMHGIRGEIGVSMPVGEIVGWILAAGEAPPAESGPVAAPAAHAEALSDEPVAQAIAQPAAIAAAAAAAPLAAEGGLLRATPLARSLARQRGIDLATVRGSGPDGRILAADLLGGAGAATDAPGLHLQWLRTGQGAPLVLIHGFGADLGSWRPLLAHLPATLPVLALDLPSHGKSPESGAVDLAGVAAEVLDRLTREGVETAHVLGHSLGGGVALALLQQAAVRVRSLTLLAPLGLGGGADPAFIDGLTQAEDESMLKAVMGRLVHEARWITGSFVATALQQLQRPGRREALRTLAERLLPVAGPAPALHAVLAQADVPVHVLWGREDCILPWAQVEALPPSVGLHLLPGVGHLPQVEAGAWVGQVAALQCGAVGSAAQA